jgi:hypothetical protein
MQFAKGLSVLRRRKGDPVVQIVTPEILQWSSFPFIRAEDNAGNLVFHAICLFPDMWHSTNNQISSIIVGNNDNLITSLANMVAVGVRRICASNRVEITLDDLRNAFYGEQYMGPSQYIPRIVYDTARQWESRAYGQP